MKHLTKDVTTFMRVNSIPGRYSGLQLPFVFLAFVTRPLTMSTFLAK